MMAMIFCSLFCVFSWLFFLDCVSKILTPHAFRQLGLGLSSVIVAAIGVIVFICEDRGAAFWCLGGVWSQLAIMVGIGAFVILRKPAHISL
ncbi:hypothetical protein DL98DRAFT_517971 [Cadophora sp. DSE1049]|nr:hypothetical protein DL98DRAFT_517971 [Cadophora sp. DSE1049]